MYREPFCKRHFVPIISFSCFFRAFGYVLCVFLAIVASFASGGVWIKRKLATAQADVQYQYKALAHFTVTNLPLPYSLKLMRSRCRLSWCCKRIGCRMQRYHSLHDRAAQTMSRTSFWVHGWVSVKCLSRRRTTTMTAELITTE